MWSPSKRMSVASVFGGLFVLRVSSRTPRVDASGELVRSVPTLSDPHYSQSLERGLAILGCFAPGHDLLGINQIADELGISRSTTHRYVITLVALGYLEQERPGRKYRLGSRVTDLRLAALDMVPLRIESRACLEELRRWVSYTVSVAVLAGEEALIVERLHGFRGYAALGLNVGVASRLPAYCTSMGKILLAYLPDDQCRVIVRNLTLSRRGPNTITKKHALSRELLQIRDAGFAVNDEELAAGVLSIAVPVRSENDEILAAIDIAAPTSLIDRAHMIEDLSPHLVSSAERLSACLGYRREDVRQLRPGSSRSVA